MQRNVNFIKRCDVDSFGKSYSLFPVIYVIHIVQ